MMNRILVALSFVFAISLTFASERPDHGKWDKLLKKHVSSSGNVDYKGFYEGHRRI